MLVRLSEEQCFSCMCFQAQTSAGDPPLLVSWPQQGQLHPQQRLRLLLRQHPQALTARPWPQLPARGRSPEPVPVPRAAVHPTMPGGGARELLMDPRRLLVPTVPNFKIRKKKKKTNKKNQKHWKQYNAFSMPAKLSDVLILLKSSSHCLSSDYSTSNLQPSAGYLQLPFHCFLSTLRSA